VLDYAVDLDLGTPEQGSFWSDKYGSRPDPAFILPWRYDPEKNVEQVSDTTRQLTREISTLPLNPRPGQNVKVQARVSNFSLLAVGEPFSATFYLGDPESGGQMLHSQTINAGRLGAQEKKVVEFDWAVPRDISTSSFAIYCVLDREGEVEEIHEDNNTGWNEIFLRLTP